VFIGADDVAAAGDAAVESRGMSFPPFAGHGGCGVRSSRLVAGGGPQTWRGCASRSWSVSVSGYTSTLSIRILRWQVRHGFSRFSSREVRAGGFPRFGAHMIGDGPADDEPGIGVHHRSAVDPALLSRVRSADRGSTPSPTAATRRSCAPPASADLAADVVPSRAGLYGCRMRLSGETYPTQTINSRYVLWSALNWFWSRASHDQSLSDL
jgi:hypothetical protein